MRIAERAPRETGREYALRVLRDNIVRLELAPGSMVSENELAAQMGLSRTPVREALIELSRTRIVEIYPQRGSAVALIDHDRVEEARFVRSVLECAVAGLACEMAAPAQLAQLEENVRLQEFYLENRSDDKLMELDNAFHRMLFDATNKLQTYALLDGLTVHFDRVRSLSLTTVKDLKIVADHRAILEAIRAKDAAEAAHRMEKHLARYKIDEQSVQEKYPQYFK